MFSQNIIITLFLISLTAPRVKLQAPIDRCTPGVLSVCNDCLNEYICATGLPDPCSPGEVCDIDIGGDQCSRTGIDFAPACFCTTVGCVEDPINPELIDNCAVIGDLPIEAIGATCPTTGDIFDAETCTCGPVTCPDCGLQPINPSETCIVDYQICEGDANYVPKSCQAGFCFDVDICGCIDAFDGVCPDCGFIADPSQPDSDTSFCFCDSTPSVCGLECTGGKVYDSVSCECTEGPETTLEPVSISVSPVSVSVSPVSVSVSPVSVPVSPVSVSVSPVSVSVSPVSVSVSPASVPPTTPTSVIDACQPCGLAAGSGTDCSEYYTCNTATGGVLVGPYFCPGNLCFDAVTCACI